MNSTLFSEIRAMLAKEFLSERRDSSATYTAAMLSISTVFALAFTFFGKSPTADVGAGLLWVALLFAGVGTLTRLFVAEDESGTGDLLRLWSRPEAVFWGKLAFAFIQMLITSTMVTIVFIVLTGLSIANYFLLVVNILFGSVALASVVTLVSALISRGSNKGTLATVVALPILLPLIALGVSASRGAFDPLVFETGVRGAIGVGLYGILVISMAPLLFASIWRESD